MPPAFLFLNLFRSLLCSSTVNNIDHFLSRCVAEFLPFCGSTCISLFTASVLKVVFAEENSTSFHLLTSFSSVLNICVLTSAYFKAELCRIIHISLFELSSVFLANYVCFEISVESRILQFINSRRHQLDSSNISN